MKHFAVAFAVGLVGLPVAAAPPASLPGVSDEETTIPSGGIRQFHRGKGDVLFVLDRAGRWYRLKLNEGCLKTTSQIESLAFDNEAGGERIDRFTEVQLNQSGGTFPINCRIESIRQSEAPPQVNSSSKVTLD